MTETTHNEGSPATDCYAGVPVKLGTYLTEEQETLFRSTFPDECCSGCRFWDANEGPAWDVQWSEAMGRPVPMFQGQCKRHAPVALAHDELDNDVPWWPETDCRDWCGDFTA